MNTTNPGKTRETAASLVALVRGDTLADHPGARSPVYDETHFMFHIDADGSSHIRSNGFWETNAVWLALGLFFAGASRVADAIDGLRQPPTDTLHAEPFTLGFTIEDGIPLATCEGVTTERLFYAAARVAEEAEANGMPGVAEKLLDLLFRVSHYMRGFEEEITLERTLH